MYSPPSSRTRLPLPASVSSSHSSSLCFQIRLPRTQFNVLSLHSSRRDHRPSVHVRAAVQHHTCPTPATELPQLWECCCHASILTQGIPYRITISSFSLPLPLRNVNENGEVTAVVSNEYKYMKHKFSEIDKFHEME